MGLHLFIISTLIPTPLPLSAHAHFQPTYDLKERRSAKMTHNSLFTSFQENHQFDGFRVIPTRSIHPLAATFVATGQLIFLTVTSYYPVGGSEKGYPWEWLIPSVFLVPVGAVLQLVFFFIQNKRTILWFYFRVLRFDKVKDQLFWSLLIKVNLLVD